MSRKKKLINNTDIPQYAIERFTRCIFDDVRAYFATEEGQKEYAAWEEQENKKRAARNGGSAALYGLLFSGATGFGLWPYGCAIGEIGLFVSLEINK